MMGITVITTQCVVSIRVERICHPTGQIGAILREQPQCRNFTSNRRHHPQYSAGVKDYFISMPMSGMIKLSHRSNKDSWRKMIIHSEIAERIVGDTENLYSQRIFRTNRHLPDQQTFYKVLITATAIFQRILCILTLSIDASCWLVKMMVSSGSNRSFWRASGGR